MTNRNTTIIGAILAVCWYLKNNGITFPTSRAEWWNVIVGVLIAGLGYLAADAKKSAPVLLLFLLAGCAALGSPPTMYEGMTADQIKAITADKSASVICISGVYMGANLNTVAVNVDRGTPSNLTIDPGCKLTFGSVIPSAVK